MAGSRPTFLATQKLTEYTTKSLIEKIKNTNLKIPCIIGRDYNVDLLCKDNYTNTNFINNLNVIGLHPIISLPTRVTDHSATLLDNFLCDINLLPINSAVIKTNINDHYMIELPIKIKITSSNIIMCNLSEKNKKISIIKYKMQTGHTYAH